MKPLIMATAAGAIAYGAAVTAQTPSTRERPNNAQFVTLSTMLDASVTNQRDPEKRADVDDFVVDTRTGRILYAIIDTNGILGSDDRTVAIPYGALTWDAVEESYRLTASSAQVSNLPEWRSSDWKRFQDGNWYSTLRGIFGERSEISETEKYRGDEYSTCFNDGRAESLKGKVVSLNRNGRTLRNGEYYAVVVQADDTDSQQTVLLAPPAYLSREAAELPSEGSVISVLTVKAYNADGEVVRIAQTINVEGKAIKLRDDRGIPAWQYDDFAASKPAYLMLASNLNKGSAIAQGEDFGSVHQTVFEPHSGTLAFVVLSVGGMLGVDDTLYPVPSGVIARSHDDKIYIDIAKSKIILAPKLSAKETDDLNKGEFTAMVYDFYGTKQRQYDLERSNRWINEDRQSADN